MCHTRDGFSRIDFTLKKNTRPPRAHTVSTGPRYFHVSVRSASTNIGDHRGKPRQRRIERKATRLGEREREKEGRDGFFSFCTEFWMDIRLSHDRTTLSWEDWFVRSACWRIGAAVYTNAYFFHLVYSRTYSVSFPSMLKQARFRGKGGQLDVTWMNMKEFRGKTFVWNGKMIIYFMRIYKRLKEWMYQWNTIIFSSFQVLKIRMEVWNQRDPMITYWNASWKLINIVFNENADLDNGFVTAVVLGKFTSCEILYIRST